MSHFLDHEPMPTPNGGKPIWDLVIEDMKARDQIGRERYGTPLQANNGRRPLVDAYQECLDLAVYLRQEIEERQTAEECQTLAQELADAKAEVARLRTLIDRDRTGLAAGLAEVRKVAGGYGWLAREGEWGSYEYNEQTVAKLRQEMSDCLDQIEAAALGALQESGRRVTEAFRPAPAVEGGVR